MSEPMTQAGHALAQFTAGFIDGDDAPLDAEILDAILAIEAEAHAAGLREATDIARGEGLKEGYLTAQREAAGDPALREAARKFLDAISAAEADGWNWTTGNKHMRAHHPQTGDLFSTHVALAVAVDAVEHPAAPQPAAAPRETADRPHAGLPLSEYGLDYADPSDPHSAYAKRQAREAAAASAELADER